MFSNADIKFKYLTNRSMIWTAVLFTLKMFFFVFFVFNVIFNLWNQTVPFFCILFSMLFFYLLFLSSSSSSSSSSSIHQYYIHDTVKLTKNFLLIIIIKFQGVPVTMVTHGARGEGETLNEAVYTDTLQTKSRL